MKQIPLNTDVDGNCSCLKANYYKMGGANFIGHTSDGFKATCVMEIVGNIYKGNKQAGRIYSKDGICPTLSAMEGGNTEPKIIERDTPMKGNYTEPRICTMVGRDPNNPSSRARSDHYEQFLEMGDDVSNTLTSVQKDNLVAEPRLIEVGNIVPQTGKWKSPQRGRVFSPEGISPSMDTCSGGNREPKIIDDIYKDREARVYNEVAPTMRSGHDTMKVAEPLRIPQATKQGYIEVPQGAVFDMSYPESTTRRGRVQEGGQVSPTLMAGGEAPCHYEGKESTSYRIRKLTPRECFRLMGVTESDIDKIQQSGVSQSQQYKMAGNSIVVDCLYHMFRKMFTETACESQQLSLF